MKIGVFGGSFDPPHIAHLILAQEACSQLALERLLWVLTPNPPHKRGRRMTPAPQRWEMLELALQGSPVFVPSRIDIDRPAPQFAVDTLHLLRQAYPEAELVYLIGGDSLRDLPTWRKPMEVIAACSVLGVFRRPRVRIDLERLETLLPGVSDKIRWVEAPRMDISATRVRHLVSEAKAFRYYVPDAVHTYIIENELYRPSA